MNSSGNIIVSWPYGDNFDFDSKFPKIRPLLFSHGFNHRAATSSSFILFSGTKQCADNLQAEISKIDSDFIVEWEPSSKTN